jgi:predicted RNA-binding protein
MCESTAYILREGKEEIVLENVDFLENSEEQVRLVDLFGEEKIVKARVKTLSLVDHKIVLEPL